MYLCTVQRNYIEKMLAEVVSEGTSQLLKMRGTLTLGNVLAQRMVRW
jgi:hypothetical protein